ncbi:MAG: GNAT family N-acetyltransferase [Paracoccaceae bacterium]
MIHFRTGGVQDAGQITDLLNDIITQGDSTAMVKPVDRAFITDWITSGPRALWVVAEDDSGTLMGFQCVTPHKTMGETVAQIGTYARVGQTGLGIGSGMFEHLKTLCRAHEYTWVNAEIRADNSGGLAYYQSRGFEDYGRIPNVELADGRHVDKVLKRYDL